MVRFFTIIMMLCHAVLYKIIFFHFVLVQLTAFSPRIQIDKFHVNKRNRFERRKH